MATHRVPTHLSEGSQRWMTLVRDARELNETEWRLLTLAAEAYDRAQTARRTIGREGLTLTAPVLSKKGEVIGERVTAHPAAAIARDSAALFSKLSAQLGLDARTAAAPDEEPEGEPAPQNVLQLLRERSA